ncbi:MAG: WYL domain-containing protein [Gammaproteobacteria bacterium]|nr:WYL domain-containing protein [Gammaproteobacteria bacterium]MDH5728189.1 WYL domain-containing protein [Gammaproteobacteria bacterium]
MADHSKLLNEIKWNTRQRMQFIEMMAYYTGVVTRSDVAKAFGLSDAAATKDLKLYQEIAPDNLVYKHTHFGFVPSLQFSEFFADLSPAKALTMIAQNLATVGGPYDVNALFGITSDEVPLPNRLPDKELLAQITRAIHHHKKLHVRYYSLSDRQSEEPRIIEPHALVNTGLRWHVRAYCEDKYDFRDFVLSRFLWAETTDEDAESSADYDEDWSEFVVLKLIPHPKLSEKKQQSLLIDYQATNGIIEVRARRALVGYALQRLNVDNTEDLHLNPNQFQLAISNRDEIAAYAGWALS